jgi:hypothetical protein
MEPIVPYPDAPVVIALRSMKALLDDILDYGIPSDIALSLVEQPSDDTKEVMEWLSDGTTSVSDAVLVSPNWGRA